VNFIFSPDAWLKGLLFCATGMTFVPCLPSLAHYQPPALLVAEIEFRHGAVASAAFSLGALTVPRYCPCFLMTDTRQLRSLAAMDLYVAAFFGALISVSVGETVGTVI
jgi:hypothetical protein